MYIYFNKRKSNALFMYGNKLQLYSKLTIDPQISGADRKKFIFFHKMTK